MGVKQLERVLKESYDTLSTYNGDKETIHNRLLIDRSIESIGVIDSVLAVDTTVYAIVRRLGSSPDNFNLDEPDDYFNCDGDVSCYSPFELMMPIINIHLNLVQIDPKNLIGGKVLVSEIHGIAMKAEYIGQLHEVNESPVDIPRTVLKTLRNYIGGYNNLNLNDKRIKDVTDSLGIPQDTIEKLNKYSVSEWAGNVVRFNSDASYYKDNNKQSQGELVIEDSMGKLIRHINEKDMKTRDCHLPITLFSAR